MVGFCPDYSVFLPCMGGERQCVEVDSTSGIANDANDRAIETMGDPKYPLGLVLRVITVSLRTMEIVKGLPVLVKEELW